MSNSLFLWADSAYYNLLVEEKSAFAETSNRGKLNNTISCTWLLPLATRPCKRERDGTLYVGPTSDVDTGGSNVSCVRFSSLTMFDVYTGAALKDFPTFPSTSKVSEQR